ncbi:MAG: hypothetical protein ABI203_11695 [Mucilaginibacter sp.]
MLRSVLLKAKEAAIILLIVLPIAVNYGFGPGMSEQDWLVWTNKCLSESYIPPPDAKLKKWEIELSPDHFLRLRKTYQHDRQEYFSFHISKLDSMNYLENTTGEELRFKTANDDIIIQTYEDPKGNIDSTSNAWELPVKNISPPRLDSLNAAIKYFKNKSL